MKKWEYKTMSTKTQDPDHSEKFDPVRKKHLAWAEWLSDEGQQGWELISVVSRTLNGDHHEMIFFLKREISSN